MLHTLRLTLLVVSALLALGACAGSRPTGFPVLPDAPVTGPAELRAPDGPHGFDVRLEFRTLDGGDAAVALPRLTVRAGQEASVRVEHQRAFLAGATWTEVDGGVVGDPRIDVTRDGVRLDVLVDDAPQPGVALLGTRIRFAARDGELAARPVRPASAGGVTSLQFPRTRRTELIGVVRAPLGRRVLLGHLPSAAGDRQLVVHGTVVPVELDSTAAGESFAGAGIDLEDEPDPTLRESVSRARTAGEHGLVRARVVLLDGDRAAAPLSPPLGVRTATCLGAALSCGTEERYTAAVRARDAGGVRSWETQAEEHVSGLRLTLSVGGELDIEWTPSPRWRETTSLDVPGEVRLRAPLDGPLRTSIPLAPGERLVRLGHVPGTGDIAVRVRYEPDGAGDRGEATQTPANR